MDNLILQSLSGTFVAFNNDIWRPLRWSGTASQSRKPESYPRVSEAEPITIAGGTIGTWLPRTLQELSSL
ncbi:hypothetical protein KCP71_02805 [Salmonella enterica subsp. enterica]|nr:hypothetical protein KCP71_02805 [Salmonella enterica subsp. enterica]